MKKTVLTFGLISGGITTAAMLVSAALSNHVDLASTTGEVFGYTTIVLSMLLVFFGVRSYRENVTGGHLTFGRGFGVGLLITLVSCALYVGTWEFVQYQFFPDFGAKYAQCTIDREKAKGSTPEKIAAVERQMADFQRMYANPVLNVLMTFAEPFPVGVGATLISAAILRRRK